MNLGLLRTTIRSVLVEKAQTASGASRLGLALYVGHARGVRYYVLYDAAKLVNAVIEDVEIDLTDSPGKYVRAVVMVDGKTGGAWHASEIEATAAEHGFGPLLYDVAMKMEKGLVPDRESVSPSARGVWDYYKTKRSDVTAKPLDDIQHPATPSKVDDAPVYPGGADNALNYAYFIDGGPNVSKLTGNHKKVLEMLKGLNRPTLQGGYAYLFSSLGQEFFDMNYSG